jgi:hypothetical protein
MQSLAARDLHGKTISCGRIHPWIGLRNRGDYRAILMCSATSPPSPAQAHAHGTKFASNARPHNVLTRTFHPFAGTYLTGYSLLKTIVLISRQIQPKSSMDEVRRCACRPQPLHSLMPRHRSSTAAFASLLVSSFVACSLTRNKSACSCLCMWSRHTELVTAILTLRLYASELKFSDAVLGFIEILSA